MAATHLAWLRNDLRLADNPALSAAVSGGGVAIAVYIHEETDDVRPPGGAARWWLHQSLVALETALAALGIALIVDRGDPAEVLPRLVAEHQVASVYWNRRYGPGERAVDSAIKTQLRAGGVTVESFAANLLIEPWEITTGAGKPYSVFTPFWKSLRQIPIASPLPAPVAGPARAVQPVDGDYRQPQWAGKLAPHWRIGEAAAQAALASFLEDRVADYAEERDFPSRAVTSRLSPHLRFGEISPRQIWQAASLAAQMHPGIAPAVDKFLSELAWRDFSYHQLYHRADIAQQPMQAKYSALDWRDAPQDLAAWQAGRTGLPIIDAGMRELWETGSMHNRVRMLVASLLSKNLLIDWRWGEQWFWDCLVDADVASNPASWQWVAGCGLDAAPYFRIFNPVTQGKRFDPDGHYVRRWVPELARLPDADIHSPWEAPPAIVAAAGVRLGRDYPRPIVDLKTSRERALAAAAAL